jgi:RNA polymerase sigma factor (TIGR02999 family)
VVDDITRMLEAWADGDPDALERLMPLVYDELRRVASRRLARERREHTLQPTALVHEAYLRLAGQRSARFESRAQFFALAARMMRRILVDHARSRAAAKRRPGGVRLSLDELPSLAAPEGGEVDLVALDTALERLAALDERQAKTVELRYFAGLSIEETAAALGLSPATVKREWTMARAWLRRELGGAT